MNFDALNQFVCVPIPSDLYARVAAVQPHGVSTLIHDIVEDFLDRNSEEIEARKGRGTGLRWDDLYLPDGTRVRTKYRGDFKEAEVREGQIVWQKKTYESFSQLARAMRGDTSNNAWKVLEVKRPGDGGWKLADFLRR
ncbi:MAG TPA: DUF2924 domain-containing protein [Thiomonas arsenitoxydans]|mgnify:CR=1 FL=1|jgi:hypothetical protein|uniref:DUF2924 domain-containing protein n=1 Tax=Thiomonas intermedia (strain K12) TaxID=75379 RepID=D5X2A4_THIK1|nr:MAG: DUF2924 domain-containing protein [Thiomonas sp. 14-64-326]HOI66106.1 DUF2924 domain-containing protein [Thiomonas arsenitoxydans]